MNPEQFEECAKRAFEIFAANTNEQTPWGSIAPQAKFAWTEAVRSHHLHPGAIGRQEPNLQERCVAQAYAELHQPASEQPLKLPDTAAPAVETKQEKPKGAKNK